MTVRRHPLLVALFALPLVLGLAGCGGDDDDEASTDTDTEADAGSDAAADDETTTTEAEAGDAPVEGDDAAVAEDGAGEAVATVFDSSVAFDDKVANIEDGETYRADHEAYVGAADRVGGITVEPTDVVAEGETATVTYRVLFAGTEAYADLSMDVNLVDGAWVVPAGEFCGFLASARTPCASPPEGS
jgi:iron complex transport system substrate-binding protein